jgi:crotonobetainyl-CoA:carnitine CoA-transferase CaiB-like acyl-CoA transferase
VRTFVSAPRPPAPANPFAMLNSNKRGITLDQRTDRRRDLLLGLAEPADVFVEN